MLRRWTGRGKGVSLVCFICLVCTVGLATAGQPDKPDELVGWDVLPNGMIVVQYDQSGDGLPDAVALHQITWSGWTTLSMDELLAQAAGVREWIFVVDYDLDRYVYLARAAPLFVGSDPAQRGNWTAVPATSHQESLVDGTACPACPR